MNTELIKKKKEIEIKQYELNIARLETRLLELDEEKQMASDNIEKQKAIVKQLKEAK